MQNWAHHFLAGMPVWLKQISTQYFIQDWFDNRQFLGLALHACKMGDEDEEQKGPGSTHTSYHPSISNLFSNDNTK